MAHTQGIPRRRVEEVIELTGLRSVARKRVGAFSLGMAQRLGIAAALLGDPATIILDEPVNGLDPEGVRWIRELLTGLAAEGRTVFVSSHLMSEISLVADHLIVVGRGRRIQAVILAYDLRPARQPLTPGPAGTYRKEPLMPTAEGRVETDRASRYLAQLGEHAGHLGRRATHGGSDTAPQVDRAEWSDTHGILRFPDGRCTLQATSAHWSCTSRPPTRTTCAGSRTASAAASGRSAGATA